MNTNIQTVVSHIVSGIQWSTEEGAKLGQAVVIFVQTAGLPGLKVATDVLTDVAQKGVTPAQAMEQLQDVAAFNTAVLQASAAIKAQQSSSEALSAGQ